MNKLPITALAAIIILSSKVAVATKTSLADGKFQMTDLMNYVPVLPHVNDAFANIGQVPKQFIDIDAAELVELKELVKAEYGPLFSDEQILAKIDASLEWIHSTYKLVNAFKA